MAHAVGAQAGCDEHFDIFGTEGQLKVPDAYGHGALQVFLRNKLEDTQLNITIPAGIWTTLSTARVPVYAKAIQTFVQAIQNNQPVSPSGYDARQVLAIVLAIYQATTEQRTISMS
jgi:predicted dehydrogenase